MDIAPADHATLQGSLFRDGRFHNPHDPTIKTLADVWRWRRLSQPVPWPRWIEAPSYPAPEPLGLGQVGATFIGHSTFLLRIGGRWVLTDPVWSPRASPFRFAGPRRVRAPGLAFDALPGCDLLLVSHNHYDHMDFATLRRLGARFAPPAVTGLGNGRHLARGGVPGAAELDWWQSVEVAGLRVTYVPAQHFSARGLRDRNRSLWGGFVVEAPDGATVLFAGDSGWCPHFAEIGRRFPRIDLALIPIGAYEPRWFMRTQHMDPEEAVQAHLAVGARRSLAMHFGTFAGLTDEGIDAPAQALAEARTRHRVPEEAFRVPGFGETLVIGPGM